MPKRNLFDTLAEAFRRTASINKRFDDALESLVEQLESIRTMFFFAFG